MNDDFIMFQPVAFLTGEGASYQNDAEYGMGKRLRRHEWELRNAAASVHRT